MSYTFTNTSTASVSFPMTNVSTGTFSIMTGMVLQQTGNNTVQWVAAPGYHKKRGWNGKTGVRCSGCARWAKVVDSGADWNYGLKTPWYKTDCKRCGKDEGFVGKRT